MLPIENELVIKFLRHLLTIKDSCFINYDEDLYDEYLEQYRDKIIRIDDEDYVLAVMKIGKSVNTYSYYPSCVFDYHYKLIKIPITSANFFVL